MQNPRPLAGGFFILPSLLASESNPLRWALIRGKSHKMDSILFKKPGLWSGLFSYHSVIPPSPRKGNAFAGRGGVRKRRFRRRIYPSNAQRQRRTPARIPLRRIPAPIILRQNWQHRERADFDAAARKNAEGTLGGCRGGLTPQPRKSGRFPAPFSCAAAPSVPFCFADSESFHPSVAPRAPHKPAPLGFDSGKEP